MKVFLVLVLVLIVVATAATAATAMAFGSATVTTGVAAAVQVVDQSGEPAALLLSGSLLLGLAGAVKRFTV
jgi:hypothetical protein